MVTGTSWPPNYTCPSKVMAHIPTPGPGKHFPGMRASVQRQHDCGVYRMWPQAPSSLVSSILSQQTYPLIRPLPQCGYGSFQMVNEDAINSNSTPFHSQYSKPFANCFHLISQQIRVGKTGSWFSLNRRSSRCTVTYLSYMFRNAVGS